MAKLLGQYSSTALAGWPGKHKHKMFQSQQTQTQNVSESATIALSSLTLWKSAVTLVKLTYF